MIASGHGMEWYSLIRRPSRLRKGAERRNFSACTMDLLTNGMDVPALRNVVFMWYMRSPITFYHMLGPGARIHEASGTLIFRVYNYVSW